MNARRRAARRLALLAAAVTAPSACIDIGTGAGSVQQIAFDTLTRAVVFGDTLRDSAGRPARLAATVFDAGGDPIADAAVAYIRTDTATGVRIIDRFVVADAAVRGGFRRTEVVAVAGGLQSLPRVVELVYAPDTIFGERADSVTYAGADTARGTLVVRVDGDSAGTAVGVRAWWVRLRVAREAGVAVAGSTRLGAAGTRLRADTALFVRTGQSGTATAEVRFLPQAGATATDSVVVEATALVREGTPVAGSPARVVIRVRRRT